MLEDVDFIRYAEASASLLNADLADRDDLSPTSPTGRGCTSSAPTGTRTRAAQVPARAAAGLRGLRAGDTRRVIDGLNELMERHPITPRISDHDGTTSTCTSPPGRDASPTC